MTITTTDRETRVRERRRRFVRELALRGLEAAVVASPPSFFWLTGYHTPSWALTGRPIYLLAGPGGAQAFVNRAEAQRIESDAVDVEAVPYVDAGRVEHEGFVGVDYVTAVWSDLIARLERSGVRRVGVELSTSPISYTTPELVQVMEHKAGIEVVDVSRVLTSLRRVKDDVEVAGLRRAAEVLGHAFAAFEDRARPGATERELRALFHAAAGEAGADLVSYIVLTHVDGDLLGPPSERTWERGGMLYLDCGLCLEGYWADLSRHYVASDASDAQLRAYEDLIVALAAEREAVRPGATCADVAGAVSERLGDSRYGRFGHGIGCEFLESPSLSRLDPTPLEPGMTLCVEPIGEFAGVGELIAEEMVVVTDDGCELLSPPMPTSLPVLG